MAAIKKRCLRARRQSSESSDLESEEHTDEAPTKDVPESTTGVNVAEAIRELQNARKRRAGISLAGLSTGTVKAEAVVVISDPLKLKTGGLVHLQSVITGRKGAGTARDPEKGGDDEEDVEARLAMTFATETNKRDEDAEMIRYIEEEVAKRKGLLKSQALKGSGEGSDLLRDVPEYLRPAIGKQKEEMLSNQMLCGIPEVDLGVSAKMRNIEATEEAKQDLLKQRFTRCLGGDGSGGNGVAPTNVAVNFVQHRRWNSHNNSTITSDVEYQRDLLSISTNVEPKKTEETSAQNQERSLEAEKERIRKARATDTLNWHRYYKNHRFTRKHH